MTSMQFDAVKIKNPTKEGYLDKQSRVFRMLRRRWVVLQGRKLYTFKEAKNYDNPTEVIDLESYDQVRSASQQKDSASLPTAFEITSSKITGSFYFVASSEGEKKAWVRLIKSAQTGLPPPSANNHLKLASSKSSEQRLSHPTSHAPTPPKKKNTGLATRQPSKTVILSKSTSNKPKSSNKSKSIPPAASKKKGTAGKKGTGAGKKKGGAGKKSAGGGKKKPPPVRRVTTVTTTVTTRRGGGRGGKKSGRAYNHRVTKSTHVSHSRPAMTRPKSTRASSKNHKKAQSSNAGAMVGTAASGLGSAFSSAVTYFTAENTKKQEEQRPHEADRLDGLYWAEFTKRPLGIGIIPYNYPASRGAMVAVNTSDVVVRAGSRIISVAGERCKDYTYDDIKAMLQSTTLPIRIRLEFRDEMEALLQENLKLHKAKKSQSKTKNFTPRGGIDGTASEASLLPEGHTRLRRSSSAADANDMIRTLEGFDLIGEAEEAETDKDWAAAIALYEQATEEMSRSLGQQYESFADADIRRIEQKIKSYSRKVIILQRRHPEADVHRAKTPPPDANPEGSPKKKKKPRHKPHSASFCEPTPKPRPVRSARDVTTQNKRARLALPSTTRTLNRSASTSRTSVHRRAHTNMPNRSKSPARQPGAAKKRSSLTDYRQGGKPLDLTKHQDPSLGVVDEDKNNSDDEDEGEPEPVKLTISQQSKIKAAERKARLEKMKKPKTTRSGVSKKKSTAQAKKEMRNMNKVAKGEKAPPTSGDPADDDDEKTKEDTKGNKQDNEFRNRLMADIIDESPDVSFRDVQGLVNVKLALYESIILPQLRPEIFTGLRSPTTGLLLFGPPGNGKTMIAKCVAAECNSTFFSISASSITSKFVGDAERIMRTLFGLAREKAPSIIFIDEIDSMLTARGGKSEAESSRRIKTEFLVQFDGVHKASDAEARILVIGATNLPQQLDEAVLRRFSKRILVPLPDDDTRFGILYHLMAKQRCEMEDKDYNKIVKSTKGYSCSDLKNLCKDSAMGPIRQVGARIVELAQDEIPLISLPHFQQSLRNIRPSLPPESVKSFDVWDDNYGSKMHLSLSALPDSMRPRGPKDPQTPPPEETATTQIEGESESLQT